VAVLELGACCLDLLWSLEVGAWTLGCGIFRAESIRDSSPAFVKTTAGSRRPLQVVVVGINPAISEL
jgi:hypothetical protein